MRWIVIMAVLFAAPVWAETPPNPATAKIDREVSDAKIRIHTLTLEGRSLTREQVNAAEAHLDENPEDLDTRYKLLGAYHGRMNANVHQAKAKHIYWLIENRPEDMVFSTAFADLNASLEKETYDRAVVLWDEQIEAHPENARILVNASRFSMRKDRERVSELLVRARKLEPENPEWARRLAGVLQYRAFFVDNKQSHVTAYAAWMDVYELVDADQQLQLYPQLAKTALNAGHFEEAESWATKALASVEQLEPQGRHGEAINVAHNVLGRLALDAGKLDEAKKHLLESAVTPGSPTLSMVGPNLKLAELLSQQGHHEVVAEYLQACKGFWRRGTERIDKWVAMLEEGDTPYFGENLKL